MYQNFINLKTLLLVEDDSHNLMIIEEYLKPLKVEILIARNGLEAVNIVKQRDEIDMVLMDIRMPVMNGLEAAKKIRLFRENLPVILQTAMIISPDIIKNKGIWYDDYIVKPFTGESLRQIIMKQFDYPSCILSGHELKADY